MQNADLRRADLGFVKLNYANLKNVNLVSAVLKHAHLDGADLTNANLSYAYLRMATLKDANLTNITLTHITGNREEIKTIQLPEYMVNFTINSINIYHETHSVEKWKTITPSDIKSLHKQHPNFWEENRDFILKAHKHLFRDNKDEPTTANTTSK